MCSLYAVDEWFTIKLLTELGLNTLIGSFVNIMEQIDKTLGLTPAMAPDCGAGGKKTLAQLMLTVMSSDKLMIKSWHPCFLNSGLVALIHIQMKSIHDSRGSVLPAWCIINRTSSIQIAYPKTFRRLAEELLHHLVGMHFSDHAYQHACCKDSDVLNNNKPLNLWLT